MRILSCFNEAWFVQGHPMRFRGFFAVCLLMAGIAPAMAQVDVDRFLKRDTYGEVKISPTGAYYAATVTLTDRTVLIVLQRSDGKVIAKATGGQDSAIADFQWVNDKRLVVAMAKKYGALEQPYPTGELHGINADGSDAKLLIGSADPSVRGEVIASDGSRFQYAELIDTLPRDLDHVLVAVSNNSADPVTRVVKLDVATGKNSQIASAPLNRAKFVADADGVVRLAEGQDRENISRLLYRDDGKAAWRIINDQRSSHHVEWPIGFATDGRTAYLQVRQAKGPDAIVAFDTVTGTRRQILCDDLVDPEHILYSAGDSIPVGAVFMSDRRRSVYFDERSPEAETQRLLAKAFPGENVEITSSTADAKLMLLKVSSDRNPGDFYLFDRTSQAAKGIFSRRQWLVPSEMAATRSVQLTARDGMNLHGYLTLPKGKDSGLPMVVVPHGGPFGVADSADFDEEAQLLAEAGYAVLRINFRGSKNYGRAFEEAGARQWGAQMQDDVTDATRWAIEQRIADPQRVCIYGASYGAYAAMMALVREPDLYRCGVGYAGVYDLSMMYRELAGRATYLRNWSADWVGTPDMLEAISPVHRASSIKRPVFLAAGGKDFIAPIEHSRRMEKALREAGVVPETLYFATEGHGFYTEEHRHMFYVKLLDFLSSNIGGAKAK